MKLSKIQRSSEVMAYGKYVSRGFHFASEFELSLDSEFDSGRRLDDNITRRVRYAPGLPACAPLSNTIVRKRRMR